MSGDAVRISPPIVMLLFVGYMTRAGGKNPPNFIVDFPCGSYAWEAPDCRNLG